MENKFYTSFDLERVKQSRRTDDYRSPFQIDRDRIIHSSEFRRLQGKTQVFLPGEYDFYRTRLTHSIEVAQIGRSICNYLCATQTDILTESYYIDSDLVEAICLAHDLGHPPFGHAGERTLNKLMKKYGGFEGNGQTLRLVTEIFYRRDDQHRGLNPSRAFLDGILKYKATFSDFKNPDNHFIYDKDRKYLDFVFGKTKYRTWLKTANQLNDFKSIECQIMDWADDTAYAINDLVDSISGGFITISKLSQWQNEQELTELHISILEEIIDWIKKGNYKARFGAQIGFFIRSCKLKKRKTFMDKYTNRYKYNLEIPLEILERAKLYKKISIDLVFHSSALHQIEFKGNSMIEGIFNLFEKNYVTALGGTKLLPDFNDKIIRKEKNKKMRARMICDYIAGSTDSYATRMYRRLFDIEYSSLTFSFAQESQVKNLSAEDLNGNLVKLSMYNNKILYISFWALWCQPCRAELKVLQNIFEEFEKKDVYFVGINIDTPRSLAKVKAFCSSQKITFPILLDPNSQLLNALNGQALPYSLLVDKDGKIVKIRTGYQTGDEKFIKDDINTLLNKYN
ncbi:MAG: deoxyguanosinetriphosphate triphosphohydrolase [Ignavibacteria bacterium]|nr:MAG: deoxyguanosinetriphosphate triphosphohydrolase [Ignavibacteria bacterium]